MSTRKQERKLPVQQLTVLAICRFAEPLASTSLYPYLPEMIRSFNVPDADVGKWAGITAATFSICQATMGIAWGRASDRFGRKPAILLGLTITMLTSLLLGFSTTLAMAIFARAIAGLGNGNVGIIRTTVAEMVPYKELQPRAFSIMPLVWNIGSIFGPSMGGALANPFNVTPGERPEHGNLFERYPYALPNMVSACIFFIGITNGLLFLRETLETKRDNRDFGLMLGKRLLKSGKSLAAWARGSPKHLEEERVPLIDNDDNVLTPQKPLTPPPWKDILTKQTLLNLALYAGLAMHHIAFDQVLPVYLSDKPPDPHAPRDNFLNFAGGFGLDHLTIGMLNTAYAIYGMFFQFLLFPPIARKYGVLFCFKWTCFIVPVVYALMPFTLLLPTLPTRIAACFALQMLKETCAIFAFPCSTILLTNSASSLRILGTLNGVATSVSAIGRAAGPALTGAMYTVGAKEGYLIAPWWFLTSVAIISALPVAFVVEQEGFADRGPDEEQETNDMTISEDELRAEGLEGEAEAAGQPGPDLTLLKRKV